MRLKSLEDTVATAIRTGVLSWGALVNEVRYSHKQPSTGRRGRKPHMVPMRYRQAEVLLKETLCTLAQRSGISFVGAGQQRYRDLVLRLAPVLIELRFGTSLCTGKRGTHRDVERLASFGLPQHFERLVGRVKEEGMAVWVEAKQEVCEFTNWLREKLTKLSRELARHIFPPKRRRRGSPTARTLLFACEVW